MMLFTEKFCEARAEWTWVYIARYINLKWEHIRCKIAKDSKTETCLGPLLISGSGFVIGWLEADLKTDPYNTTKSSFCFPNLSLPFSVTR